MPTGDENEVTCTGPSCGRSALLPYTGRVDITVRPLQRGSASVSPIAPPWRWPVAVTIRPVRPTAISLVFVNTDPAPPPPGTSKYSSRQLTTLIQSGTTGTIFRDRS